MTNTLDMLSIKDRMPPWFQDDLFVKIPHDEMEELKINTYYNILRRYPVQPIQVWRDNSTNEVKTRLWAHELFPLKKLTVRDSDENVLHTENFSKFDIKTEFDIGVVSSVESFYVEVEYFGLYGSVKVGFPQEVNPTDTTFALNDRLDLIAKSFGLHRRVYRDDITQDELDYCYPKGYGYPIEQDYFFEKRILEEYTTRYTVLDENILYDDADTEILRVKARYAGSADIEIFTEGDTITATMEDMPEETFTFVNLRDLVIDVNANSKIIKLELLEEGTENFASGYYYLFTEGVYPTHGLVKSAIYQELGVIPEIQDMSDNILIWNEGNWNQKVWAGDIYSTGVFIVQIPYHRIPKNFEILTNEEIQQIIDKHKKFGTYGVPTYYHEEFVETSYEALKSEYPEILVYADVYAEFDIALGDLPSGVVLEFGLDVEITSTDAYNLSCEFTIAREIIGEALLATYDTDTQFAVGSGYKTTTSGSGSGATTTISKGASTENQYPDSGSCYTSDRGSSYASWINPTKIAVDDSGSTTDAHCAYSVNLSGTHDTDFLYAKNFGFAIPDGATITGVALETTCRCSSMSGSDFYILKGSGPTYSTRKDIVFPTSYAVRTLGSNGDTWDLSLTPDEVNASTFGVRLSCRGVGSGNSVWVDYFYLTIYYEYEGGVYQTGKLVAPGDGTAWSKIDITETVPASCDISYEIIKESGDAEQTGTGTLISFGTTSSTKLWQTFKPVNNEISGVSLRFKKIGSPTDNLKVSVYSLDGSGNPSIALGVTTTVLNADIQAETADTHFTLPCPYMSAGESWGVLIERTGSSDNTNYYQIQTNPSSSYSDGAFKYYNGSSWITGTGDAYFKFYTPQVQKTITGSSDISDVLYTDIKVRSFLTSVYGSNPSIDTLKVYYKEVIT